MRAPLRTMGRRARATVAQLGRARAPRGAADGSTTGCGHQNIPLGANGAEPYRRVIFFPLCPPQLTPGTQLYSWVDRDNGSKVPCPRTQRSGFFFVCSWPGLELGTLRLQIRAPTTSPLRLHIHTHTHFSFSLKKSSRAYATK